MLRLKTLHSNSESPPQERPREAMAYLLTGGPASASGPQWDVSGGGTVGGG